MITINLVELLTILNSIMLGGLLLYIFKQNFKIVDMETYNSMMEIVEEYAEGQEKAGGTGVEVGFGADYLEDEEEDE